MKVELRKCQKLKNKEMSLHLYCTIKNKQTYLCFVQDRWRIDDILTPGFVVNQFLMSCQQITAGIIFGIVFL